MGEARVTNEEVRAFFEERASIEEEYARKITKLTKEPFGSVEIGSLKESLVMLKLETANTATAHAVIARQIRTDLEQPHSAVSDVSRDKRKSIQNGVEKTFKLRIQQEQEMKKAKERCEAEFLKMNGLMAQQNLLIGRELERNNTRLEKVRGALLAHKTEYETAIAQLNNTIVRWKHEWRQACDQFQALEEERIETTKTELWKYANIISQVCVTDDESCEKLRLSLERCTVGNDIRAVIEQRGTGDETSSGLSPSAMHRELNNEHISANLCPDNVGQDRFSRRHEGTPSTTEIVGTTNVAQSSAHESSSNSKVINEHPLDGITQLCRSDSSATFASGSTGLVSQTTSSSIYSTVPGTRSSVAQSYVSHDLKSVPGLRRKKSMLERAETWARRSPSPPKQLDSIQPLKAHKTGSSIFDALRPARSRSRAGSRPDKSSLVNLDADGTDPRAADVLNIGINMLPSDPIAAALQRLSVSADRQTLSQHRQNVYDALSHNEQAPTRARVPPQRVSSRSAPNSPVSSQEFDFMGKAQPTTYVSCKDALHGLGAPPAAHSAAEMYQTASHAKRGTSTIFGNDTSAAASVSDNMHSLTKRAQSRSRARSISAHPSQRRQAPGDLRRSPSPNPAAHAQNNTIRLAEYRSNSESSDQAHTQRLSTDPVNQHKMNTYHHDSYDHSRSTQQTKSAYARLSSDAAAGRPTSIGPSDRITRSRTEQFDSSWQNGNENALSHRTMSYKANQPFSRPRSKSFAETNQAQKRYTKDGQEILAIVTALYDYEATIAEEIGFRQGDNLAIIEMREDGWWLGEKLGAQRLCRGLVPSNFFRRAI
ncbi:protein of unknown function [Taphrina deformans PYCC 5710]|uniref:Cell division control protein n=1 Tax=Taphrina deformans (strain PYCC 5710 / ATCC 11124 / CBS 356.35 / IMI 108563 / JCM 9778 / NBRC 8474) TaxID=1097556 RepID=R4XER8_TAPDE|nr:protein of unknown function [Taphrina deformans PYCC 5710]|eukprot:CCG84347.1 protein of unknown function [Taphrina deformans PYCC 5710]